MEFPRQPAHVKPVKWGGARSGEPSSVGRLGSDYVAFNDDRP